MKNQSYTLFLVACTLFMISASHTNQQNFDKISVKEFELVGPNGQKRASIQAYDDGEVVFRLMDQKGTIRVKIGASEDGSGLVLLNDSTNVGVHALAKKKGTTLTLINKDGKKREY
jgi:hypothetical protein